ncbi:hypothetical protein D6817_01810 [Candidatus Pacearchaeota archaeon]|nr:MAG: hypothetical protein D6817_01810 [Candidatus Pacearchaeota archaeon]
MEREHIPSPKNNILLIGVRKIEAEESKFMIENDAQYIEAREIRNDFEGSLARVKEFLTQGKLAREQSAEKTRVYVSFDIDVLDPSIAGATHYKEQDGISLSEARALIRTIKSNAEIAAADIVELNLDFPSQLETTLNSVSEIANELNRRDSSK